MRRKSEEQPLRLFYTALVGCSALAVGDLLICLSFVFPYNFLSYLAWALVFTAFLLTSKRPLKWFIRLRRMRRSAAALALLTGFFILVMPLFVQQGFSANHTFRDILEQFLLNAQQRLDEELVNKEQFGQEFADYQAATNDEFDEVLSRFIAVIRAAAEQQGDLGGFSNVTRENFDELAAELQELIARYPEFETVESILTPLTEEFIDLFLSEFPALQRPQAGLNPLSPIYDFYLATEKKNPWQLGSLFRIEFLRPALTLETLREHLSLLQRNGIASTDVKLRDHHKITNGRLVFHKIIKDNQLYLDSIALKELTILHSVPEQMRRDRVDERRVRFVQEYIKLINFHLIKAFHEDGLVIDINHPHLVVPEDYSPAVFIQNFIAILVSLMT